MTFPDDVPTLTDGVVTLRAHRPDDAPAVLEQCTDPLSQRWTTVPVPYAPEDAVAFVTDVVPSGWSTGADWAFAVEAAGDDGRPRFCGTVSLRDEGNRRAEVAFGSHPWARGRGLVRRALELLLDWGFTERRLRTVIWWANRGNWASRRLAWRLGFSFDGTVTRWLPQRGDLLDGWLGTLHVDDPRRPRTTWLEAPVVEGERVRLRPLRDDDVARIVEACSDERTQHWLGRLPRPYTADDARAWIDSCAERLASGDAVTWAVADPATDLLLGCVNAFAITSGRDAEIGFWAHPDARGRGLTTDACRLVVRHCFVATEDGGLGLARLQAAHAEGNAASRHVIESAGFRPASRFRRALVLGDGTVADRVDLDLLVEDVRVT